MRARVEDNEGRLEQVGAATGVAAGRRVGERWSESLSCSSLQGNGSVRVCPLRFEAFSGSVEVENRKPMTSF
jgi:hypothetical protein